jgi:hypothetical protein
LLDPPEICDLCPHVGKMAFGSRFDLGTGLIPAVDQLKQAADFLDRKAEFAGPKDEAKRADVAFIVDTVAVLLDKCKPVSDATVALSFMPSRGRASRREQRHGSA